MTYRDKQLKKIRENLKQCYSSGGGARKAIPVGHSKPTTFNEAVMQILYNSGQMTQEQYLSALGIGFDYESSKDFSDDYGFDDYEGDVDGFTQSERASYAERSPDTSSVGNNEPQAVPENATASSSEKGVSGASADSHSSGAQPNSSEHSSSGFNENNASKSNENQ